MLLLNQHNDIVVKNVDFEIVQKALIFEYIDHIDYNISDSTIYDIEAIVIISDILQSIKFANDLTELQEYINNIGGVDSELEFENCAELEGSELPYLVGYAIEVECINNYGDF